MNDLVLSDWTKTKFQDLITSHNSGVYKQKDLYGEGSNIIGVSQLYLSLFIDDREYKRVPLTEIEKQKYTLNENDLVYGESSLVRSGIARTVCVTKKGEGTAFAWHTRRLKINSSKVHSPYLAYLLDLEKTRIKIESVATQTALTGITTKDYFNVDLKLPPLKQQKKIAKILNSIDNLIELTQSLIDKYTAVKRGTMADLFTCGIDLSGTPETNEKYGQLRPSISESPEIYQESELGWTVKDWDVYKIEDILNRIIDYRGKTPTKTDSGVPLITAKNVRFGYIEPEPREFIASSDYETWMTRGIPNQGDVLFTTEAPLANVAQIGTDGKVAFAQRVIILQTNTICDSTFLKYLLMSEHFRRKIFSRGSGSTVEGVKQSEFKKVRVCLPKSNNEQIKIVKMIDSLTNKIVNEESEMHKYIEIKKGLMKDLLTGKVRVN